MGESKRNPRQRMLLATARALLRWAGEPVDSSGSADASGAPTSEAAPAPETAPSAAAFLENRVFRSITLARIGLIIDVLWAVGNIALGVYGRSLWAITLGVYYACLAVMRALLSRHERRAARRSHARNLALCRRCGIAIMLFSFPVTGIMLLNLHGMGTFSHPMQLTIGVATYAFAKLGAGIANFVRYRGGTEPLMLAASNVSLAGALATLLTMGILMLNVFSDEGTEAGFRVAITVGMGVAVTVGVFVMGLALALRAGRLRAEKGVDPQVRPGISEL